MRPSDAVPGTRSASSSAAAVIAGALLLGFVVLPASPARAASDRSADPGTPACPATLAEDEFDDAAEWTTHEHAVDCLAWWGVSIGFTTGRYAPHREINRGQIATFFDRTLTAAGTTVPSTDIRSLPDVPTDHTHHDAIVRLTAAGVLRADGDGRFRPDEALRRDDMAVFLVAAWRLHTGLDLPAATTTFPDVADHPDRAAINAAATLGFTAGTAAGHYAPAGTVSRDRMASFLTRLLDDLVANHGVPLRTAPAWGDIPPGRTRYLPLPDAPVTSYRVAERWGVYPRWNPCLPIDVVVDLSGAPHGANSAVRTAVQRLRDATGLALVLRERTGLQPDSDYDYYELLQPGQIQVVWPRRWHAGPGITGLGGYYDTGGWISSGAVMLNPNVTMTQEDLTAVLMHELAHAVGLDHPDDPGQIMSTTYGLGATWAQGDLAGLARVGRGMGCPAQPFRTHEQLYHGL